MTHTRTDHNDAADFAGSAPASTGTPLPPTVAAPAIENIPETMRRERRWVVWAYELRNGKLTKVPYNTRTLQRAASDDPATWSSFDEALRAYERGGFAGIGFMLGDGFVGLDLDHCRDAETGEIEPEAAQIIADLDTYTEASPSGTGAHSIAIGRLPLVVAGSAKLKCMTAAGTSRSRGR